MENDRLHQVAHDLAYAHKCLRQVLLSCQNDLLTKSEQKSNEGGRFAASLLQSYRSTEVASQCLSLLLAYRNPSEHETFLDQVRKHEDMDTDYSGSILPDSHQEE